MCFSKCAGLMLSAFAASFVLVSNGLSSDAPSPLTTELVSLDGPGWTIAADPQNVGAKQRWFEGPRADAKPTQTPSIIQDVLHNYHGVAWYWREFTQSANPHAGGRCLLRFWQVDYLADVWLNGVHVGQHEGGEDPFVLDVTDAVKPNAVNRLAVRVLNPTNEPIDGFRLAEIPRRNKSYPPTPGCDYNYGGITDSVELLHVPSVRVEDLFVRPDPKTGTIRIQANLRNASSEKVHANLQFTVSPAASGETLNAAALTQELPPGDTLVETTLTVDKPVLWELNCPFLYRVSASASVVGSPSIDQRSTRCGFRDFRYKNGGFRLNGKRLFLKCSHTGCELPCPRVPVDPDLLRKDIVNCKAMGFNSIRFIAGIPPRFQLELCDEIGLMVYEECYAGWCLQNSPEMAKRFDHSVSAMIRRDRNHPSITLWGLLNETPNGPVVRHAAAALPMVRALDDTRVVIFNSGRWDKNGASALVDLAQWQSGIGPDPNVTFNMSAATLTAPWAQWPAKQLALHPGPSGERSVVRWIAPAAGGFSISVEFVGIGVSTTTDVHVFVKDKAVFDGRIAGTKEKVAFSKKASLAAGDIVSFVVGKGENDHGGDTTGLNLVIRAADGKTWTPAADFSYKKNPCGPWEFGYLKPSARPNLDSFSAYTSGSCEEREPNALEPGTLSNPGTVVWEDCLMEGHPYQPTPHTAAVMNTLRTIGAGPIPYLPSEHGTGSAVDLPRLARHFEQWHKTDSDDAVYYRGELDKFMTDWKRWNLSDTFACPEDYFRQCLAWMANERLLDINAIRANPNIIGYSLTGTQDQGLSGEGLTTLFREPKPGTFDDMFDAWYPVRWCLFIEPVHVYRGRKAHLEAVLANEDEVAPGQYPVRFQIVGPKNHVVFDRVVTVNVPDPKSKPAPKLAIPMFSEDVVIDGPSGEYRFLANFQNGVAAAGGNIPFYVADPADMPTVKPEVVLWGDDPELAQWLASHGIKTRRFAAGEPQKARDVILVGNRPEAGGAAAFADLAQRIARGSHAVFLNLDVFKKDDKNATGWLPMVDKLHRVGFNVWLYHKDDWAKNHPVFDGLPTGRILDATAYRNILSNGGFNGQTEPAEIIAGAIHTACGYNSGLTMAVYRLGEGHFTLNSLRIRESLPSDPVAERLLRNLLNHAGRDLDKPLAALPGDFTEQLKAMGYHK